VYPPQRKLEVYEWSLWWLVDERVSVYAIRGGELMLLLLTDSCTFMF
jgi:hypothetical protein